MRISDYISSLIPSGRRTFRPVAHIGALLLMVLASCGGKGKGAADTATTADTAAVEPATEAEQPRELEIDSRGVAGVGVGMLVRQIPPAEESEYDAFTIEEGNESNMYIFTMDENPVFIAYEFGEGTVDMISAESPHVYVALPDGGKLRLGDEFSHVLALPGVRSEWENADGEGMWCWEWQGLWFQPDQSHLTEALGRELYNEVAPPAESSFSPDVKIGYIGTGLPW